MLSIKLFTLFIVIYASSGSHSSEDDDAEDAVVLIGEGVRNQKCSNHEHNIINFIVILADPDVSIDEETPMKFCEHYFKLKKTILPCTDKYLQAMPREIMKYVRTRNIPCDCEKILTGSLMSLLQWAETSKGMSTASVKINAVSNRGEVSQHEKAQYKKSKFPKKRSHQIRKRDLRSDLEALPKFEFKPIFRRDSANIKEPFDEPSYENPVVPKFSATMRKSSTNFCKDLEKMLYKPKRAQKHLQESFDNLDQEYPKSIQLKHETEDQQPPADSFQVMTIDSDKDSKKSDDMSNGESTFVKNSVTMDSKKIQNMDEDVNLDSRNDVFQPKGERKEDFIVLPFTGDTPIGNEDEQPQLKKVDSHHPPLYEVYHPKAKRRYNNINPYSNSDMKKSESFVQLRDVPKDSDESQDVQSTASEAIKTISKMKGVSSHHNSHKADSSRTKEVSSPRMDGDSLQSTDQYEGTTTEAEMSEITEDTSENSTTSEEEACNDDNESTTVKSTDAEVPDEPNRMEDNLPEQSPPAENIWELLNLMNSIKSSFMTGFFNSIWGGMNANNIGEGPTMESMVGSMLDHLNKLSELHGYIAIIHGGRMSDLNNVTSDLVKTLINIKQNAGQNTVVVLTGSCPSKEKVKKCEDDIKLPLFVAGPHASKFKNCNELYDISQNIKCVLEKHVNHARSMDSFPVESDRSLAEALVEPREYYDLLEEHSQKRKRSAVNVNTEIIKNNCERTMLTRLVISFICFLIFRSAF
ncbi:PREDICTED: uncharacterized protein LOC108558851 [Nicrophorus vespilloides]|uniref:Uncharacterized protein LOC108558851 n=1 Tax=Nicrophorus vespilloides TaxID=110193 RepID=A0ABM1M9X2_NICVS|nr:PREDICTED: uncharacterized protein LOC108558851 [Nicrophorus vespilloides]